MLGFIGKYLYSVDEKGRVNLPSKFRKMTKGKMYVLSRGLENCLFVFPKSRWSQYVKSFMPMTFAKKADRDFFRLLGFNTESVLLDDQGRVKIREDFMEYAGLKKEVLLIGVMDHIEIWDPDRWESYQKGIEKSYSELAEEALSKVNLSDYIE